MWDLKLQTFEFYYQFISTSNNLFFGTINLFDPLTYNSSFFANWKSFFEYPQNVSFFFGIKFLFAIAFLILIRGGTPRYRYDYLTKLGWLKFLSLMILIFFFCYVYVFYLLNIK